MDNYQERKARRMDRISQYAQRLGRYPATSPKGPITLEVRKALRSKGWTSHYEPTLTYWVLGYSEAGQLFYGKSFTPAAYGKAKRYLQEHQGALLPV